MLSSFEEIRLLRVFFKEAEVSKCPNSVRREIEFIKQVFGSRPHQDNIQISDFVVASEFDMQIVKACGLPCDEVLGWDFDPKLFACRMVAEVLAFQGRIDRSDDRRMVLAGDYGLLLCVNNFSGPVVAIDTRCPSPETAINSSLLQFLYCLACYIDCERRAGEASHKEQVAIVAHLRDEILRYDATSLSDRNSWWSFVIEQAELDVSQE